MTQPANRRLVTEAAQKWQPNTDYLTNDVRQAPDGSTISRNADGTSLASFDSTEQAAWTAVLAVAGSMEQAAADARYLDSPALTGTPTVNGEVLPSVSVQDTPPAYGIWVDSSGTAFTPSSCSAAVGGASSTIALATGVNVDLDFNQINWDDDVYANNSGSYTVFTINTPGRYKISMYLGINPNSAGRRILRLIDESNASVVLQAAFPGIIGATAQRCEMTSYVKITSSPYSFHGQVFQDSGASITLSQGSFYSSMIIERLG